MEGNILTHAVSGGTPVDDTAMNHAASYTQQQCHVHVIFEQACEQIIRFYMKEATYILHSSVGHI